MPRKAGISVCFAFALLLRAEADAHKVELHEVMADNAMDHIEAQMPAGEFCVLSEEFKAELHDGARDEDAGSRLNPSQLGETSDWRGGEGLIIPDACRNKNHGYNPITDSTGGLFTENGGPLCCFEVGGPGCNDVLNAKQRATNLWATMKSAFASGDWTGGDQVGAFHYLGRVAHLLQDMSAAPHVHPQDVAVLEHGEFEAEELERFEQTQWTAEDPLFAMDTLPDTATSLLDMHTEGRLSAAVDNSVESFIDLMARLTYFRASFFGQVVFAASCTGPSCSGDATTAKVTATTFDDGGVDGTVDNVLHVMFDDASGNGEVRYVFMDGDDYFEITDANGNGYTWANQGWLPAVGGDTWFPATNPSGVESQDGHRVDDSACNAACMLACDGDPTCAGHRITGRFLFANPWAQQYEHDLSGDPQNARPPVLPRNYPDGSAFAHTHLGEYISEYSIRLAQRYNAGLIGQAIMDEIATTGGEDQSGVEVRGEFDIKNMGPAADGLSFDSFNVDATVQGWCAGMNQFSDATSSRNDSMSFNVANVDAVCIATDEEVHVAVTQWTNVRNAMGYRNVAWNTGCGSGPVGGGAPASQAIPDHHWSFDPPEDVGGGGFRHTLTFENTDSLYDLRVENVQFAPSMVFAPILEDIVFSGPSTQPPGLLAPDMGGGGGTWSTSVDTTGDFAGGAINFTYQVYDINDAAAVFTGWGSHPVVSLPTQLKMEFQVTYPTDVGVSVVIDSGGEKTGILSQSLSSAVSHRMAGSLGQGTLSPLTGTGALTKARTLPVRGLLRVCLLDESCKSPLSLPLTADGTRGVGIGGLVTGLPGGIGISLVGAPWTVGTASIPGALNATSGGSPVTGTLFSTGFVHAGTSTTVLTSEATGVLRAVTPIQVTTDLPPGVPVGGFIGLTVRFIPEPRVPLLLLSGVACLLLLGRKRMRN